MATVNEALLAAFDRFQAGRAEEAETILGRILAAVPDHADANHLYGLVLAQSGRAAQAAERLAVAAAARDLPDYHVNHGKVLAMLGRGAAAAAAFRKALTADRRHVAAARGLAELLFEQGRRRCLDKDDAGAVADLREAAVWADDRADVALWLGTACQELGRVEEAENAYRRGLALDPALIPAWANLGLLAFSSSSFAAAAAAWRRAVLSRLPAMAAGDWRAYAAALTQRRDAAALPACRAAVALDPADAATWSNFGNALLGGDAPAAAEPCYRRTLRLDPACVPALVGLSDALRNLGRPEEGLRAAEEALRIDDGCAAALVGVADSLRDLGRLDAALSSARRAVSLAPDNPMAALLLATLRLTVGELAAGWDGYAARWSVPAMANDRPAHSCPPWRGEPLDGPLLAWGEQGLGDEIMFATLLPDLLAHGLEVRLSADSRLHPLLARSFPQIRLLRRGAADAASAPAPAPAAEIALGDLPRLLRRELGDFPRGRAAPLRADPDKTVAARARHDRGDAALLIGVSWRSTNRRYGAGRSLALPRLAAALTQGGAGRPLRLVSLQYGDVAADVAAAQAAGIEVAVDPVVDPRADIDGLAALICAMDLIVTIDNTTAHLAGAMGAPTWTLLPHPADWRWLRDRADSPWHPGMRLFRQPRPGDWEPVLADVAAAVVAAALSPQTESATPERRRQGESR